MLEVRDIEFRGLAYLEQVLNASNSLAQLVAVRVTAWREFVIVPISAERHLVDAVSRGGLLTISELSTADQKSPEAVLQETLRSMLSRRARDGAWIFVNHFERTNNLDSSTLPHVLTFEDKIVHAVSYRNSEADHAAIEVVLDTVRSARPLVAMLVRLPLGVGTAGGRTTLSKDDLRAMATSAVGVVVGAYDGESYLLAEAPPES